MVYTVNNLENKACIYDKDCGQQDAKNGDTLDKDHVLVLYEDASCDIESASGDLAARLRVENHQRTVVWRFGKGYTQNDPADKICAEVPGDDKKILPKEGGSCCRYSTGALQYPKKENGEQQAAS